MKFQKGDVGVSMLVVMAVMMIGIWVASGHGGSGHHSKNSATNESGAPAPVSPSSSAGSLALPGERLVNGN